MRWRARLYLAVLGALCIYFGVMAIVFSRYEIAKAWPDHKLATPLMLKRMSPLKVGLSLGFLHAMWHLAANIYGAGAFHGELFIVNFLATSIGIIGLRIVTIWIYMRTSSLVLGWLTHLGFTGGQLSFVSFALTSDETIVWNAAFSVAVIGIVAFLLARNKDLMGR